jgi:methionine aminotransferase
MLYPGKISSKLPGAGTSIFAVMTKYANDHNAINLAQGFPDFEISQELIGLVNYYMKKGFNQYAPMPGVKPLRDQIAKMTLDRHEISYDPDDEITTTAGATQAIYTAVASIIIPGDEVIIIEPAYDSYAPSVELNGGLPRFYSLKPPDYRVDWAVIRDLINDKTRMIIINSPHNPTGSILHQDDMEELERIVVKRDLIVVSDEVYEHLIYDGLKHESACRYPDLASRSFVIGSFGKTFHATGWKMGYVLAPKLLTSTFRKAHQFVVFSCNTPVQLAIAEYLKDPSNYGGLGTFFQQKRDFFNALLEKSRFNIVPCSGTYFQCADYSHISDEDELDFAIRMTKEHGIASIPLAPFYKSQDNNHMLRFCFAKKEETLEKAAEILCKI